MSRTSITFIIATFLLSGCGGGGGGAADTGVSPPASGPAIAINSLRVSGSTSETCTVSVNGAADADPLPMAFQVAAPLSDPGAANPINATVAVIATDTAGHQVTGTITMTADPQVMTPP